MTTKAIRLLLFRKRKNSYLDKNSPIDSLGLFLFPNRCLMKRLFNKIHRNSFFLLFIVLFAYVQSIDSRIRQKSELNAYTFTPDAAFGTLIAVCILFIVLNLFIRRRQKSAIFSTKGLLKVFSLSLVSYILIMQAFNLVIAFIFDNIERNFKQEIFIHTTFTYLIDGFIYGSFFLAYDYYKKNKRNHQELIRFNKALSESRINQLKIQLNPHFLFNNLNVLDELINEDKYKASDFLNEFAEIYRFVLKASDSNIIPISEELIFAKQYFKLMQHKYGNAYQLKIESLHNNGFIVPLTLQLLIENAIQHNLGTELNPVCIDILSDKQIHISNNLIPKRNPKPASGRALNNLKEQYKLLADIPMEVKKSDNTFCVIIPIIHPSESK